LPKGTISETKTGYCVIVVHSFPWSLRELTSFYAGHHEFEVNYRGGITMPPMRSPSEAKTSPIAETTWPVAATT
jgi:hypothetical protein